MYVGSLIGYVYTTTTNINNVHLYNVNVQAECTNTQDVNVYAGGMLGATENNSNVEISDSSAIDGTVYATGTAKSCVYVGGVVGHNNAATPALVMHNCLISNYCSAGSAKVISVRKICYGSNVNWAGKFYNCVISDTTTDVFVSSGTTAPENGSYTDCMSDTLEQCKTQVAVDVLNQNSERTWVLDLENTNNGFPIIKQ